MIDAPFFFFFARTAELWNKEPIIPSCYAAGRRRGPNILAAFW
jgi:hypothetical protein